ncbi:MAG TPA: hypothetical protein VMT30_02750 [Candidatus Saccharimonadia bacterium]|nr:hypothetical protein [Candidatus Saccharimonadia bacterium]
MTTLETIQKYYIQRNHASGVEAQIITNVIEQIYKLMVEDDISEREIIYLLLPVNHPGNNNGT